MFWSGLFSVLFIHTRMHIAVSLLLEMEEELGGVFKPYTGL